MVNFTPSTVFGGTDPLLDPKEVVALENAAAGVEDGNNSRTTTTTEKTPLLNSIDEASQHSVDSVDNIYTEEDIEDRMKAWPGGGGDDSFNDGTDEESFPSNSTKPLPSSSSTTATTKSYGSSSSYDDDDGVQPPKTRVSVMNVRVSRRYTASSTKGKKNEFDGDEYELVPTQLRDNVKLVTDDNLYENESGKIYFAEYSFYKNLNLPKYAMTVNSNIYRQMINEVNEAFSVPFRLYFCCHGGDAVSGVTHGDNVDIKLAWIIIAFVFVAIVTVEFAFPWPEEDAVTTDDLFANAAYNLLC